MKKHVFLNGLRVLVDPCPWSRSVALVVCVEGGLSDENEQQVGISHLLEHLLFKRTGRLTTREIAVVMDELGGEVNAYTDLSSICLYGVVPAPRFQELLSLFAELLTDAQFGEAELVREKDIIRQEILEANDDPTEVTYQALCQNLWADSIFQYPVFGTLESVESLKLEDVKARLKAMLSGNRVIVAAAGNVSDALFFSEAERHFGSLPAIEWQRPRVPEMKPGIRLIEHPVKQVHLALCQQFPSVGDPDYIAAMVFASAFGDGLSSRLFQLLREEKGIAYDVSAHVEGVAESGLFLTSVVLERENLNQAMKHILSELRKLKENPITAAEMEHVKRYVSAQLEMETDSLSSRLWRMVEGEMYLGRVVETEEVLERVQNMTLDEIASFVERRLHFDKSALALGGNISTAKLPAEMKIFCGQK